MIGIDLVEVFAYMLKIVLYSRKEGIDVEAMHLEINIRKRSNAFRNKYTKKEMAYHGYIQTSKQKRISSFRKLAE